MTPRPPAKARTRRAAAKFMLASGVLGLGLAGCDPRMALYFLQPSEPTIPPPAGSPKLKGKRVVLLTHAVTSARGDAPDVDQELGKELIAILREKVKHIDIVDPAKVRTWVAANPSWSDPAEAAKAFEADFVIYMEVQAFQIQSPASPGMLEGLATVHVQVTELALPKDAKGRPIPDVAKVATVGFDDICESKFPTRGPIAVDASVGRPRFKKTFLKLVATEVSWKFVDHAPGDDIQDSNFSK